MSKVLFTDIEKANADAVRERKNENADKLLGLYFPVLDQGFVSLVDYMGNDGAIAQAARCSYGAGTRSVSDDRNLIRYLVSHKHTSPLEQVELKFHCKMPIFVARQWVRHRTASLNEMSGRYSVMPLQFYSPDFGNFKKQSSNNKQGREEEINHDFFLENRMRSDTARQLVKENYVNDLEHDVARELARIDLPLATYTEWYWKMDLHNLMHFLRLRCDSHAQWEIRQYANVIAGMVAEVCPLSFEAWQDYEYEAQTFSYQEMEMLQQLMHVMAFDTKCMSSPIDYFPSDAELKTAADACGISMREIKEFYKKLRDEKLSRKDFKLDFSQAKPPSYFRQQAEAAVPDIKQ